MHLPGGVVNAAVRRKAASFDSSLDPPTNELICYIPDSIEFTSSDKVCGYSVHFEFLTYGIENG